MKSTLRPLNSIIAKAYAASDEMISCPNRETNDMNNELMYNFPNGKSTESHTSL